MSSGIQPPGPPPPPPPPTPGSASQNWQAAQQGGDANVSSLVAAWENMFGGMATPEQIKQMIQTMIKDTIAAIKAAGDRALEAIKEMKQQQDEDQNS